MTPPISPTELRFEDGRPWIEVDYETGCWIWQGSKTRGYGRVRVGKRGSVQAHRAVWEIYRGPVPRKMELGHTCHRRSCVNHEHVRPIPKPENTAERFEMPTLSKAALSEIEEYLLDDRPNTWIAYEVGISVWAVRRIAERLCWRDQFTLDGIPF